VPALCGLPSELDEDGVGCSHRTYRSGSPARSRTHRLGVALMRDQSRIHPTAVAYPSDHACYWQCRGRKEGLRPRQERLRAATGRWLGVDRHRAQRIIRIETTEAERPDRGTVTLPHVPLVVPEIEGGHMFREGRQLWLKGVAKFSLKCRTPY